MDQYSELDLLECKLKKVIQELSAYNQVHRHAKSPKDTKSVRMKDNKKWEKCTTNKIGEKLKKENRKGACCCNNDETDTETDSECTEKSSTSLFSTLKQLQKIEKELRKKEIELKEKELQDRITCIKLKMAEEERKNKQSEKTTKTTKNTCSKPEKKSHGKVTCECSKYTDSKYSKNSEKPDNKDYTQASATDSVCSKESFSKSENECSHKITKPKKVCGDDVCKCIKTRSQTENLCKGSYGRISKNISCKTVCCSTESLFTKVTPRGLKNKQKKGKKKSSNFKDRLVKNIQKSWSPCKCSNYPNNIRQVSSLEKIMLDAYGDCFPMALRENPQMCLYNRPIPSKKSRNNRPMWFFLAKLFCTPCFLCFLCCYSFCNLANDSQTSKSDSTETVLLQRVT